jgi:hypothetical protein
MRSFINRLAATVIRPKTNFYPDREGAATVVAQAGALAAALAAEYVGDPPHGGLAESREGLLRFRPGGRLCPPFFL